MCVCVCIPVCMWIEPGGKHSENMLKRGGVSVCIIFFSFKGFCRGKYLFWGISYYSLSTITLKCLTFYALCLNSCILYFLFSLKTLKFCRCISRSFLGACCSESNNFWWQSACIVYHCYHCLGYTNYCFFYCFNDVQYFFMWKEKKIQPF